MFLAILKENVAYPPFATFRLLSTLAPAIKRQTDGIFGLFATLNRLNIWCGCCFHLLFQQTINKTLTLGLFLFCGFAAKNFPFLAITENAVFADSNSVNNNNRMASASVSPVILNVHELTCLHQQMNCARDKRKCKQLCAPVSLPHYLNNLLSQ